MGRFDNPRIWDYIATNSKSEIEAGGWFNSFDGAAYSEVEMRQYIENTYKKLKPYLGKDKKVVEIGCASGLTMFRIAPYVKKYFGTDMAKVNLEKNEEQIRKKQILNIELKQCKADEIGSVISEKVDIVIINSVCQYFPDMNYFEEVVCQTYQLLKDGGTLYLGDILDLDLLDVFKSELIDYQKKHPDKRVKLDRSDELWISRKYFERLQDYEQVKEVVVSDKIAAIENELTKYRYDVTVLM